MILAAILLKMGGYGFLRFSPPMFGRLHDLALLVFALSRSRWLYLAGRAGAGGHEEAIAYSSVAHMGFVTMGYSPPPGRCRRYFPDDSHGASAALFLCVGVVYDRMHTREIAAYGGLVNRAPLYAAAFMVFTLANVGLPGLLGFIGEFLTLISLPVNTWVATLAPWSHPVGVMRCGSTARSLWCAHQAEPGHNQGSRLSRDHHARPAGRFDHLVRRLSQARPDVSAVSVAQLLDNYHHAWRGEGRRLLHMDREAHRCPKPLKFPRCCRPFRRSCWSSAPCCC